MKILFYGALLFCSAFFLHILIWKIRIPKKQITALLKVFLGILIIGLAILSFKAQLLITEYFHIALFFISLTLAYISTYSAMEVDSPTLVIVTNIAKKGKDGLEKEKLKEVMSDDLLLKPRINDLIADRMVYLDRDKYKLTSAGLFFANIFIFFRKLLRAGKGG